MSYNKNTGMYEGYIYCVENMLNTKKYIGQTTNTIEKRWIQHKSLANTDSKFYIHKAISKYGFDNFTIYEILSIKCDSLADLKIHLNDLEQYYIKKYNTTNHIFGYNLTFGGDQVSEKNCVKVKQYDIYGNMLKEWNSMAEAAAFYGLDRESIWASCNGKAATCNNFVWRYQNDSFDKYPIGNHVTNRVKHICDVCQYDHTGKLINTYVCDELRSMFGVSGKYSIYEVCDGKKDYYKDFIWRYKEDKFDKYPVYKLIDKITNKKLDKKIKSAKRDKTNNKNDSEICGTQRNIVSIPKENSGHFKNKKVNCYDADYCFIKTYSSITEAGNAVGLKNSYNITNVCNGKRNFAGGFRWYFANDLNQPDKTKIIN